MCGAPFSAPANTTPTAMPSGRLCMVTFNAEFFTVATRFILLFYVYACKAYYINLLLQNFSIKKLSNTFVFNVYLQLYIVCLQIYIYDYIHFYIWPFFGVGGATPWCWWCLSGVSGGAPWWCRPHISSRSPRRAVLLLNQGFGVKFKDVIALIINYLGAPFGWTFTERYVG